MATSTSAGRPPPGPHALWLVCAGAVILACTAGLARADERLVDQVMRDIGLGPDTAARIRNGEIVASELAPSSPRELAVGLTFLIAQPAPEVLQGFASALDSRADPKLRSLIAIRGSFDDFAGVVLPPNEARRYLAAAPGDTLNLSSEEIAAFHAAGSTAAAEQELRQALFARYREYVARGLDGIAPYARGGGAKRHPAGELRAASDAMVLLKRYAPVLWQLLHSYPEGKPSDLEERFYVVTYDLDGRPNYALRHRLAVPSGDGVAVAERDFYVSRGYNTAQAIAGLIAVPEGTAVFYTERVSTDQLTGFGSSLKQSIGRNVMAKQLTEIFVRSRTCFVEAAICEVRPTGPVLGR